MKHWLIIVILIMAILLIALKFIDPGNHPTAFMVIAGAIAILAYVLMISLWLSNRRQNK